LARISADPYVDESTLPTQIVHADWDLSNVLIDDGKVTAALSCDKG
jgi:Ser/Thr protein kinase RdoA (MazF antagonist)